MSNSIESVLKELNAKFGQGSAVILGDAAKIEALPTGIPDLDTAIGIGGYPKGRVIDIFGEEGAGKSALALICAAKAQRDGLKVCYIDLEHRLSADFAKMIGVDVDNLIVIKPETGEDALDVLMDLVYDKKIGKARKAFDLIVFDSVAALVTQAELEGDINQQFIAPIGQKMSSALKKLVHWLYVTNTTVIFINQTRTKPMMFAGKTTVPTGGKALAFYASIRLQVKITESVVVDGLKTGMQSEVYVYKNSVAAPYKTATFTFSFYSGLDFMQQMIEKALEYEIIKKESSWFYFGDKKWNGKSAMQASIKEDPVLAGEIAKAVDTHRQALEVKPAKEEE